MLHSTHDLLQAVNNYLVSHPIKRQPQSLYEPIDYVLSLGGKRIRPVLMLLSYNLYKADPLTILPQAVALETYHNYTLLHDDLMDNADMRRSHPTVHRRWNANTAILSGDSMLVLAYLGMMQGQPKQLDKVLALFTETALQIGEGQQYDMDFEQRNDVSEDEYIEMIRLKTSVLLACAVKIGAILADAPDAHADTLYRFGEQLGLAFQLQDDYLDVYGDASVFGKNIGGDILSNKKTYMLINALQKADEQQHQLLTHWLKQPATEGQRKINAVTQLYNDIGIRQMAEQKINFYFEQANHTLESLPIASEQKSQLRQYTNEMLHRQA